MANVATLTAKMVFDIGNYTANANKVINDTNKLKGVMAAGAVGGMALAASLKAVEMAGQAVSTVFRAIASEVQHGLGIAMMVESAETKFRVLLKSGEKAKALMKEINSFTLATPFSMEGTLAGTQKLMGAGVPTNRLMGTMRMLGEISGGNAETFGVLSHTYGEVMAKGRVMASEMNQISSAGINMREALAKEAKVGVQDLSKAIEAGKVSAIDFHNALHELATGKYKGGLQEAGKDLKGIMDRLSEIRDQFSGGVMAGISERMGLKELGNDFAELAEGLSQTFVPAIVGEFEKLSDAAFDLMDNLRALGTLAPSAGDIANGMGGLGSWMARLSTTDFQSTLAGINTKRDFANGRNALKTAAGMVGGGNELPESKRKEKSLFTDLGKSIGSAVAMDLGKALAGVGGSFGNVAQSGYDTFRKSLLEPPAPLEERKPTGALVAGSSEAFSAIIRSMFGEDKKKPELEKMERIIKATERGAKDVVEAIKGQITGILGAVGV